MARKKKESEGRARTMIGCPVCRSQVASDGSVLFQKSDYITDLEKTAEILPHLEEKFKALNKVCDETQAQLEEKAARVLMLELLLKEANEREGKNRVVPKETESKLGRLNVPESNSRDKW